MKVYVLFPLCILLHSIMSFFPKLSLLLGQDGSYKASYKTGNHIDAQETGFIKDINEEHPNGVLVQHGEYQYEAPNGDIVKVQYTADGNYFSLKFLDLK